VLDSRHRQIARIYQCPIESDDDARAVISADPGILASGIFLEAADSDDVTDVPSALVYFDARMEYLAEFVGDFAPIVRHEFEHKIQAWE